MSFRNRHDGQFSRDRVSSRSNHVSYPDHDGLLRGGLHAYGRRATDQDGLLRKGPRAYGHDYNNRSLREGPSAYGHDANNRFLREGSSAYAYHADNRAVFREGADPYGYHADSRAAFPEAPPGYGYNASDRDDPFRSDHRAYDYTIDGRNNRPRSGYYAHDYRGNEQDAYRSSYRVDDYRPLSNDERRRDEMRQASRNKPKGNTRHSEARPLNDRNDDRRQQPSRQPAKPHHGPSTIDRYVPDRPGQNLRAEPSSLNVQHTSDQNRSVPRKSGSARRREEGMAKSIFRAWFAKQVTRYNKSKGRADTADVSQWHIPYEVVVQYLYDKSIGELPDPEEVKARLNDQEYLQSLFKWRIRTDRLDAHWDANGVKLPLPLRSWLEANLDKRPIVTEAPVQVLPDRTLLNTTQLKQETQTQRIEQTLPGPANADMLSDLELFHSDTFFMSRRRPIYSPSNPKDILSGVPRTQAL